MKCQKKEMQKKLDKFPRIDAYLERFDGKSLAAVIERVLNLESNLLKLQTSTLAFINRKVDEKTADSNEEKLREQWRSWKST